MYSNINELISTQEAARILKVSPSTIRRWTNDGTLKCYRVGKAEYRKIPKESVLLLLKQFYGTLSLPNQTIEEEKKHLISKSIKAESHPAQYLMHKYWGRKAHNIISEYIDRFTNPGDTILDPFMGSGVTIIEAIKSNRNAIGIDINPMSSFIVKNSISSIDFFLFEERFKYVDECVKTKYNYLYTTKCPICGQNAKIETAIWENDKLVKIRAICPTHKTQIKDADPSDIELINSCEELKCKKEELGELNVPHDAILNYVKRSGRNTIDELFSSRALLILSELKNCIMEEKDDDIRNLLLFCFSSMLSNVSRMLPGDKVKATYKSGWVISKFWTPKINTERNIFDCFKLRYQAIIKGKKELLGIKSENAKILTKDASDLSFIPTNTIDYIFTDPPYGESIAYLALSHFWNAWLFDSIDYENEIIIDQYRNKGYEDYETRTKAVYLELFRVLKPEHYISFTFNNRDLRVWKAVLDACLDAGFILEKIVLQEQAVSSGTQGINRKNTLTGDFVYTFKKTKPCETKINVPQDTYAFVLNKLKKIICNNDGVTPTQIYESLIPEIVKNNAYSFNNKAIDIDAMLNEYFEYVDTGIEEKTKLGSRYKWVQKKK